MGGKHQAVQTKDPIHSDNNFPIDPHHHDFVTRSPEPEGNPVRMRGRAHQLPLVMHQPEPAEGLLVTERRRSQAGQGLVDLGRQGGVCLFEQRADFQRAKPRGPQERNKIAQIDTARQRIGLPEEIGTTCEGAYDGDWASIRRKSTLGTLAGGSAQETSSADRGPRLSSRRRTTQSDGLQHGGIGPERSQDQRAECLDHAER